MLINTLKCDFSQGSVVREDSRAFLLTTTHKPCPYHLTPFPYICIVNHTTQIYFNTK